ncbi:MAG TPA: hypothetical protein VFW87_18445, partial [Pirellulales bacterium]|nr:hypothetical protein [Pirellulales bacterium]
MTNSFSLANYSAADKPTVYFNYYLSTQGASSNATNAQKEMLDSARLLISDDGGKTWNLLATNNPYRPGFKGPEAELPYYQSTTSETGSVDSGVGGLQAVQPLFDSVATATGWRQARIDLSDYAGQNNLAFRFDFSTAGSTFNPSDLAIGSNGTFNPYGNNTAYGNQFGQFQIGDGSQHPEQRGQDNSHEGWYIDDIVVGFAERGEMVTAPNATTNYFNMPVNPDPNAPKEVQTGQYQLEIRRGTEFGANSVKGKPDIGLYQSFDTNNRFADGYSIIAPAGSGLTVGETFTLNDGVHQVTFEFIHQGDTLTDPSYVGVVFKATDTAETVAFNIVKAINANKTLVNVSAAYEVNDANGAQGVSQPATDIVNLFNVVNVTAQGATSSQLAVTLDSASVTESSVNNVGRITRTNGINLPLTVNLSAIDPTTGLPSSDVTYPDTVTFTAGSSTAIFFYSGVVNGSPELADGTHTVEFLASAAGYTSAGGTVDVTDDANVLPQFSVLLNGGTSASISENPGFPGYVTGTVTINTGPAASALAVNISSLLTSAALVSATPGGAGAAQATVTIPAGATQATFYVFPVDDNVTGRPTSFRNAVIAATAAGFVSGSSTLKVLDDSDGTIPYGVPAWSSEGPAPNTAGQAQTPDGLDQTSGAIETVLPDPLRPNVLYVGTVNGGIWKTTNYNPAVPTASPTWTPLTDNLPPVTGTNLRPSLAIGAMQFDPTDLSYQTLIAGIGRFSSFANIGGSLAGLLRTTDGGKNWTEISPANLQGLNFSGVAERGSVILAGANQFFGAQAAWGLYRSTDTGGSFVQISGNGVSGLPAGPVTDLVGDPVDPKRFYVAVLGSNGGIFTSDDNGATWQNISPAGFAPQANTLDDNMRIATSRTSVFFGYVENGQLASIYYSPNPVSSSSWQPMDIPKTSEGGGTYGIEPDDGESEAPGSQGVIHFAIAADPNNPTVVYVGGDRQPGPGDGNATFPNSVGATDYTGRLFRGDASITGTGAAPSPQWMEITNDATANNTAPHADSRHLAFDSGGNLINTNDGGIYALTKPSTTSKSSPT